MSTTVETTVATNAVAEVAVKVEKEPRIALPVIEVADYKTLDYTTATDIGATSAFLNISDLAEYAQFAAVAKTCSNVKISGNGKGAVVVIDGSHPKNTDKVALLNAELADKIVVATIVYNNAERLRISAKNMGTSKVKPSARGSFFDKDLSGVVDMGDFNYIFGKEGTECTKELNTKICRVVKALVPFGLLYADEDKSGFHKTNSRIPSDNRTKDNYSWYFAWDKIEAKLTAEVVLAKLTAKFEADAKEAKAKTLEAGVEVVLTAEEIAAVNVKASETAASLNLDGKQVVADIVTIIETIYPSITVDTTKDLYIEALVSEFAAIKSEKFEFDTETRTVVSRKEEAAAAKEARDAQKLADKAAKEANKKAKKASEAAVAASTETVTVDVATESPVAINIANVAEEAVAVNVTPAAPIAAITPIATPAVNITPVAPISPILPTDGINATTLLDNINPPLV